jgi:hypothetical protein
MIKTETDPLALYQIPCKLIYEAFFMPSWWRDSFEFFQEAVRPCAGVIFR